MFFHRRRRYSIMHAATLALLLSMLGIFSSVGAKLINLPNNKSDGTNAVLGKSPEDEHDPKEKECDPTGNHNDCPDNQRCQDDNADGHWTCACKPNHYFDENRHCLLDVCTSGIDPAGEYITVLGKCFYFEKKNLMKFADSAANCKYKFNGNGRLFEPKDNLVSDISVYKQAQKISNNDGFWIGIRTQVHDTKREFYYLTEGPSKNLVYNGWDIAEPDNGSGNEDCVSVLRFNNLGWADDQCDHQKYFICELDDMKVPVCDPATTCSGHGVCNIDGSCVCNSGFSGNDCATVINEVCADDKGKKWCDKNKKKCKKPAIAKKCQKTCGKCEETTNPPPNTDLSQEIEALEKQMKLLKEDIGDNSQKVNDKESDINNIKTDIEDIDDNIGINTAQINEHDSAIKDNKDDLESINANIALNSQKIMDNEDNIATNGQDIGKNMNDIANNDGDIANIVTKAATNANGIAANTVDIENNSDDIDAIFQILPIPCSSRELSNDFHSPPHTIQGKCFGFSKYIKNWEDSDSICKSLGGMLWEPRTLSLFNDITDKAKEIQGTHEWVWMGITDTKNEGQWTYASDETPVGFTNWHTGQPDGGDCVYFYAYSKVWVDTTCSRQKPLFICEF